MNVATAPALAHCMLAATLVAGGTAGAQTRQVPPAAPAQAPCVEVRIGQDVAGRLDCLNRALREEVGKVAPVALDDAAAGLTPIQLGQPTPAALKQRFGNAYGHSLVPQRPPRNFSSPLVGGR